MKLAQRGLGAVPFNVRHGDVVAGTFDLHAQVFAERSPAVTAPVTVRSTIVGQG